MSGHAAPIPEGLAAALADPSRRVGRYVLISELGRGGMGVVYRAWDPSLRRALAVKMLTASRTGSDPASTPGGSASAAAFARFEREARAASRLRHPAIVGVHDVGLDAAGRPFIAMDLVDGECLETRLTREPPAPTVLAAILATVARALAHAHDLGIVHRDVKPENILLDREGRPFLVDFGLAREVEGGEDGEVAALTATGQVVGTPAFLAPEQARGDRAAIGPGVDLWAVGAVLYRAVAGRPPFRGSTLAEVLRAVLFDEPDSPRVENADLHPDLETITLRCLQKDPARRYPTARALADDLERFARGEVIAARPVGRRERIGRWARTNRLVAGLLCTAAAAAVAGLSTAGVVVLRTRREVAAAHEALAERALADARTARVALDVVRGPGSAGRTSAATDERLAVGLRAYYASATADALLGDDARARAGALEASLAYAEVAAGAEQWAIAETVLERARDRVVDDDAAGAVDEATAALRRARMAGDEDARREVEEVIAAVLSGEVAGRIRGEDRAVLALVRRSSPATVARLVALLDGITDDLLAATRETYAWAGAPRPDDPAGAAAIEGLQEAVERWLTGDHLDEADDDRLHQARQRMEERTVAARARGEPTTAPRSSLIVEAAQRERVGEPRWALARVIARALGRVGLREEAVAALGRHFRAHQAFVQAEEAAIALWRLGGEEAERLLMIGSSKNGSLGRRYYSRLDTCLRRKDRTFGRPLLGESARDHLLVGLACFDAGDYAGEVESLDRAVELAPDDIRIRQARAFARYWHGRWDGAYEDIDLVIERRPDRSSAFSLRAIMRSRQVENKTMREGETPAGLLDGALSDVARALELDPRNASAWSTLGRILLLGKPPVWSLDALHAFDVSLELRPDAPLVRSNRADLFTRLGDADRAIEDHAAAIALSPYQGYFYRRRIPLLLRRRTDADLRTALDDLARLAAFEPNDRWVWSERLVAHWYLEDYVSARADAERGLAIDPKWDQGHRNLSLILEKLGDIAGAAAAQGEAVALKPKDIGWIARLAELRQRIGDHDGAADAYGQWIALEPRSLEAVSGRGVCRRDAGRPAEALADLDRAAALAPTDPDILVARAGVRQALGDAEGAEADLDLAIAKNPRSAAALRGRARARTGRGDLPGALADARRASQLEASSASWFLLARIHDLRGEQEAAEAAIRKARADAPDDCEVLHRSAQERSSHGDDAGALVELTRAIKLHPNGTHHRVVRARVLARLGEDEAARADLDRAIARAPESQALLAERAIFRARAGDLAGAEADYTRIVEAAGTDGVDAEALADRGWMRALLGFADDARADLDAALERDPKSVPAWTIRARMRLRERDLDGAAADAERALALDRDAADALAVLGHVALARADRRDARGRFVRCLVIDPAHAGGLRGRGLVRLAEGDLAGAIDDLDRFVEGAEPFDPELPPTRAQLAELRKRAGRGEER